MDDPNKKVKLQTEYPEEFRQDLQRKGEFLNNLLKQYNDGVIAKDVLLKILHKLTATEVYLICNMGYADVEFIKRKKIIPLLIELDFGTEQLKALESALLKPGNGLECKFVERVDTINYPRVYLLRELLKDFFANRATPRFVYKEQGQLNEFVTFFLFSHRIIHIMRQNTRYGYPCITQGNAFLKICIEEVPNDKLDSSDIIAIFSEDFKVDFLDLFRILYRLLNIPGVYLVKLHKSKTNENLYLNEKV
jgi:hypothetical protein